MSLEQLLGRHARLERELAHAFSAQPWPGALIERLAQELAVAEAEIAALRQLGSTGADTPSPDAALGSR